ncbi:FAD-dependent monooxygenase [Nocardiopsis sp. CNS-639]|uniref:FAD-dependent monooxygenase n=1 Tax=Nocardiopsis sp. CNS-639 TaxID=1169153 RepID=UPI0004777BEE|nr:FAD-dependent monooxygenase [Nocardiopsis sp. CNS-639]
MPRVVIAGGGIGGLALALRVAQRGGTAVVLERDPQFTELGAGIQLAPNAFRALEEMGVAGPVRERAVHIDELCFMDAVGGARVAALPLKGAYRERFGQPYAVVHRTDLYQPLLDACRAAAGVRLVPGRRVIDYDQDAAGVSVRLATGTSVRGDVLVGADGIRSMVRRRLVGDGPPKVSGHSIYRTLIPMERVPGHLRWTSVKLWAGPRLHVVHYPVAGGEFLNLAVTRDDGARHEVVGERVDAGLVRSVVEDMCPTVRSLVDLGTDWRTWVLCDRDPVSDWTDGRVALLGDAAHPMLQYAAQGAAMALEDAVVLGDLIKGDPADCAQRLQKYNALRRERAADAQWVSREMGRRLYHPRGEEARERDRMLSGLSVDDLFDKVAWLHGSTDFVEALPHGRTR